MVSDCVAAHDRLEWFADDARGERRYLETLKIAPFRQSFMAAQRQPEGELRDMSSGREQITLRSE
jgi:hypothetical protein